MIQSHKDLIIEAYFLSEKVNKLSDLTKDPFNSLDEEEDINNQLIAMREYHRCLSRRISRALLYAPLNLKLL